MMKTASRTGILLTVLIFLCFPLFAQNANGTVYFFATDTTTPEDPTIRLTENLFFSQFQSENVSLIDMRPAYLTDITEGTLQISGLTGSSILFGLELLKNGTGWTCRMNLMKNGESSPVVYENFYESYYKILMDAKNLISQVLIQDTTGFTSEAATSSTDSSLAKTGIKISLDTLAGTWKGESLIDKIIILRSGRGFVIFNNGASMNISITLKGNLLEAVQTGKSNASFFPDLPREIALAEATKAEPVAWKLSLADSDTLTGIKTTLLPSSDNTIAERRSVEVTWKRL